MKAPRIALYIGNELYPNQNNDPYATIDRLHRGPLTSPIVGMVNGGAPLVLNNGSHPNNSIFDANGNYIGVPEWAAILSKLKSGGQVQELYLSFGTGAIEWMASNPEHIMRILTYIKINLGFDGIDLDYEGDDYSTTSPIYAVADSAIGVGLKLTAAPYSHRSEWAKWVEYVQKEGGTVSWLNLQCYSGGASNIPGQWTGMGVPIVAGTSSAGCSPSDVENLYSIWTTGQGSVTGSCWFGAPSTQPAQLGGGFMWVYSEIKGTQLFDYLYAIQNGLGT